MKSPDLVWLARPGENEELRYSIRSLTSNLPHKSVWLVCSDPPAWYSGKTVAPPPLTENRFLDVRRALRAACEDSRVSDPFIACDDDEYLLEPLRSLNPTHRGLLRDVHSKPPYDTRAHDTAAILEAMGIANPVSYDKHTPYLVHKSVMLKALGIAERAPDDIWIKSLYGNMANLGGSYLSDPKAYGDQPEIRLEPGQNDPGPWLSTDELSWTGGAGDLVRRAFPMPSPLEREAALSVLSINAGQDTAGISYGLFRAFEGDRAINLRSAILNRNYIDYPRDLPLAYPAIYTPWNAADVVHLHNTLNTLDLMVKRGQQDKPFVLHHHGTHYRDHHERLDREVERRGGLAVTSTLDLTRLSQAAWCPAPCRIDELAAMRGKRRSGRLRVGHAPTDRGVKSTTAFLEACGGLDVEVVLIERRPWRECLKLKATVDIFYDQVGLGYGSNAIEAWAMGIPVVAGSSSTTTLADMAHRFGRLPFMLADESTIGDAIGALMDEATREEYANLGRAHVERFHSGAYTREVLAPMYWKLAERNRQPVPVIEPMASPVRDSRPDVVWIVRPGERNEELRYSMRAVAENLPHRGAYIAGHRPTWATADHIPSRQSSGQAHANVRGNIKAACERLDRWLLMHDDIFVLRPLEQAPVATSGRLEEVLERLIAEHGRNTYTNGLGRLLDMLRAEGFEDPWSFDALHHPLMVQSSVMLDALALAEKRKSPFVFTVYGNLAGLGKHAVVTRNAKTRGSLDRPIVSTNDARFAAGEGEAIRAMFPEPSPYELAPARTMAFR